MSIEKCPFCGNEIDLYENLERSDIEEYVKIDFDHPLSWECEQGCARHSNQYWVSYCEECDHEFDVLDAYVEPCNGNPYSGGRSIRMLRTTNI